GEGRRCGVAQLAKCAGEAREALLARGPVAPRTHGDDPPAAVPQLRENPRVYQRGDAARGVPGHELEPRAPLPAPRLRHPVQHLPGGLRAAEEEAPVALLEGAEAAVGPEHHRVHVPVRGTRVDLDGGPLQPKLAAAGGDRAMEGLTAEERAVERG